MREHLDHINRDIWGDIQRMPSQFTPWAEYLAALIQSEAGKQTIEAILEEMVERFGVEETRHALQNIAPRWAEATFCETAHGWMVFLPAPIFATATAGLIDEVNMPGYESYKLVFKLYHEHVREHYAWRRNRPTKTQTQLLHDALDLWHRVQLLIRYYPHHEFVSLLRTAERGARRWMDEWRKQESSAARA
jgi:hypothetical protein